MCGIPLYGILYKITSMASLYVQSSRSNVVLKSMEGRFPARAGKSGRKAVIHRGSSAVTQPYGSG